MASKRCSRGLADLTSIGPAMLRDFQLLGVRTVAQLACEEPRELYGRLCKITGTRQDACVLDVFTAAIAQARNPELPPGQRQWSYWSRERKRAAASAETNHA
jgi:pathogenicity locus Cdd1 protein